MAEEKKDAAFVNKMRHSCAHVMAQAVTELFPGTKLGIGPAIEYGFYYDFDSPHHFVPEDLPKIEGRMHKIINERQPFMCAEHSKKEALEKFGADGEKYKVELINDLQDGTISFYSNGGFTDLCKGPHVENTGEIKHFKLTQLAGAYWRGDERNPMLQRIYGIAFQTKEELEAHLKQLEEAAKRDHRKLGAELKLFSITDECGPGLVLWHPRGGRIRKILEDWIRNENIKRGYEMIYTPHIARLHLWQTSGHASFYKENMYSTIDVDNQEYQLKPMNCPFHILVYKNELRSYRDLPLRLSELGTVYRYERSGTLHGLMRVRGFTQDDAHIFCTPEQIEREVDDCFDFAMHIMKTFGFKSQVTLSLWDESKPESYTGDPKDWQMAQALLEDVLKKRGVEYECIKGEAAFYGPKIDIKVIDAINRPWQLTTIQFDFNLPQKFDLEYVADSGRKRPYMVHRALLGSIERFFGILVEHYAGWFPLWLAPVQAKILTLTSNEVPFAKKLADDMKKAGLRVEVDERPEKIGLKIRETHLEKIPYMIMVGPKEAEAGTVTLRVRSGKNIPGLKPEEVIATLQKEVAGCSLENLYA